MLQLKIFLKRKTSQEMQLSENAEQLFANSIKPVKLPFCRDEIEEFCGKRRSKIYLFFQKAIGGSILA